jgi:hypothetical protein
MTASAFVTTPPPRRGFDEQYRQYADQFDYAEYDDVSHRGFP